MKIATIFNQFIKRFPELNDTINKSLKTHLVDDKDGIYVIWGLGIMPSVLELLKRPNNERILKNIFNFFEEMAISEDEEVRELLMYSTLETLDDDKVILKEALIYMGDKTKKLLDGIQNFLGE